MREAKDTARALVRIGYDGRVHKTFRHKNARERYENEVRVLRYLEEKGCDFVPRLLDAHDEEMKIVTTNCGARVEQLSDEKLKELFEELESYGVRHDDPYLRNVTYRARDGRFCLIDFEFATILDEDTAGETSQRPEDSDDVAVSVTPSTATPSTGSGWTVNWSGITDVGRLRPNNEDAFLTIAFDRQDFTYLGREGSALLCGQDMIFAVSDGMGGEKSGEFASRCTVDNVVHMMPRRFAVSPAHYKAEIAECIEVLFHKIHMQLTMLGECYEEGRNMGATLSLIWFCHDRFYFGHLGDSRIYLLPKAGGMEQISHDHTYVGWLYRKGELNEREVRNHPRRNVLTQSLGSGNQFIDPQIGEIVCQPGDRILLCTDGVTDGLWNHALEDLIRKPPKALDGVPTSDRLVRCAVEESGRDNATALVVEVADPAAG
ncbi:MAG: protein phosphatase 2C domain-containing protein [Planctomycetota bacterium]